MKALVIASLLAAPTFAHAWPTWAPEKVPEPEEPDPKVEDEPEPPPPPVKLTAPEPKPSEPIDDWTELDERLRKVESALRVAEATQQQVKRLLWLPRFITAYIDVGAFVVGGDGSGIRSDFLHRNYPEHRNTIAGQWVFMGDPFATAINTLGEPADISSSREVENDTVNSSGRPSFIVNTLALVLDKQVHDKISVGGMVHFLPRPGPDVLDVPLAFVSYRPTVDFMSRTTLVVDLGKIDSVLGVEYRNQDAPKRIGITPSLIARYTTGRPIGIDARLVKDVGEGHKLSISGALINGNNFDERFEPKTELRSSRYPSLAGHLQWNFPIGRQFELGVSGMYGPQDRQSSSGVRQWHYGLDLVVDIDGTEVTAEFVQGKQQGSTTGDPIADRMLGIERPSCDLAPCLDYKGAYVLATRRVRHWFLPYARVDWRDAVHRDGSRFLYESHSLRATIGANFGLTSRIRAKFEYSKNHEIGVPSFPHDVLTSSVVIATD